MMKATIRRYLNYLDSWLIYQQETLDTQGTDLALDKYEGRFLNLFAVYDFINIDDGLVTNFPGDWRPFAAKQSLSRLSNNNFFIKDEWSSEEGEKVKFIFKDQRQEKVIYAGETLLPPAVFNKLLEAKKILQKLD